MAISLRHKNDGLGKPVRRCWTLGNVSRAILLRSTGRRVTAGISKSRRAIFWFRGLADQASRQWMQVTATKKVAAGSGKSQPRAAWSGGWGRDDQGRVFPLQAVHQ